MRRLRGATAAALLLTMTWLSEAKQVAATDRQDCSSVLTIQIHDYVQVPATALHRAVELVAHAYQTIGVRTEWLKTTRPGHFGSLRVSPRVATINVIVLSPAMAIRGQIPPEVIGFAAAPQDQNDGIGHIAYVVYDRLQALAVEAEADEVELLGMVMAHEIGHLLLPPHSHSPEGLMRGRWRYADFHNLRRLNLEFSVSQAEWIRNTVNQ